jgi:hypothetical protein
MPGTSRDTHVRRAVSRDGTAIAYEVEGAGPPLVLVGGMFSVRGAIPGARLEVLPGQGHDVEPEAVVPPVTGFLLRPPRSPEAGRR